MRTIKSTLSIFTIFIFLCSLPFFTSCGGGKSGMSKSKVNSGTGMGHQKHKNKHVWGKRK